MFVVSLSGRNIKKVVLFSVVAVCVLLIGFFFVNRMVESTEKADVAFSTAAGSDQERLHFISCFGWKVDEEPVEVREVIIPLVFDDVYRNYNEIQLSQGFDLSGFAGQRVKRWTYIIRNYPGTTIDDDYVRINLLVKDGYVIGGDVCSIKLDGFMHGFSNPNLSEE